MKFSVGILYSVQEFLKFVKETPVKSNEFVRLFNRFEASSPTIVLDIAESSNWIKIDLDSTVVVTQKGEDIVSESNMTGALRVQLKHLIGETKPSWAYLIHKGRKEAYQYFPSNVKQCFKEAELIDSYDPEVVRWWDTFASVARGKQHDFFLETGRTGEELSLKFEKKRTGKEVIWQSVDSNLSGYDILSHVSNSDNTPLRIEVKSSIVDSSLFTFFLTRNEWEVAKNSPNYLFHIWILSSEPKLYILDRDDVAPNIPINRGKGVWENIKIEIDTNMLEIKNRKGE